MTKYMLLTIIITMTMIPLTINTILPTLMVSKMASTLIYSTLFPLHWWNPSTSIQTKMMTTITTTMTTKTTFHKTIMPTITTIHLKMTTILMLVKTTVAKAATSMNTATAATITVTNET